METVLIFPDETMLLCSPSLCVHNPSRNATTESKNLYLSLCLSLFNYVLFERQKLRHIYLCMRPGTSSLGICS